MRSLITGFIIALTIFGCKTKQKDVPAYPNEAEILAELEHYSTTFNGLMDQLIDEPKTSADYAHNDSIQYLSGLNNEKLLQAYADAYGNVHTDSLLIQFSGYVPEGLLKKIKPEDWETEIGRELKQKVDERAQMFAKWDKLEGESLCKEFNSTAVVMNSGEEVELCDYIVNGDAKYYLIDLWASWCAPCRTFNRAFEYKEYKAKGIEVIGLGTADKMESFQKAVEKDNTPWPQLYDIKDELYNKLEAGGVPFKFLTDKSGTILKVFRAVSFEEGIKEFL